MRPFRSFAWIAGTLASGSLLWALAPVPVGTLPASWQAAAFSAPAWLQQAGNQVWQPAPSGGPARVGVPTSAIPPGPPPGTQCSVDPPAGIFECSAFLPNARCSALNDQGNECSTFDFPPGAPAQCSAFAQNAACSVLPSPAPGPAASACSTFPAGPTGHTCSAVGQAKRQLCSVKGQGGSMCSVITRDAICSVINPGAIDRSFCSAKFNQPTVSKPCSAFIDLVQCSVIPGGKGVCTTFGQAAFGSCSAFIANAHCSVINGPAGDPCVQ